MTRARQQHANLIAVHYFTQDNLGNHARAGPDPPASNETDNKEGTFSSRGGDHRTPKQRSRGRCITIELYPYQNIIPPFHKGRSEAATNY